MGSNPTSSPPINQVALADAQNKSASNGKEEEGASRAFFARVGSANPPRPPLQGALLLPAPNIGELLRNAPGQVGAAS